MRFIDPDGMGPTDIVYLNEAGKEINRKIDPAVNRTFIIRTNKTKRDIFLSTELNEEEVIDGKKVPKAADVNSISNADAKSAAREIKKGNFDSEIVKQNTVEIENLDVISEMYSNIKDNGQGGIAEENNREYGGIKKKDGTLTSEIGEIADPQNNPNAHISLSKSKVHYHSHPSGYKGDEPLTPAQEMAKSVAPVGTTISNGSSSYFFMQGTSRQDQLNISPSGTGYQFGMRTGMGCIYNNTGIVATLPISVLSTKK